MSAGTWTLVVVDAGCQCCSYLPVRSFTDEAEARGALADSGDGFVLEFVPADEDEA